MPVKPKKHLGQHFLIDQNVAKQIADSVLAKDSELIIEIGPGTGMLTKFLIERETHLECVELDNESVDYLNQHYPELTVHSRDFLKMKLERFAMDPITITGNFPYNISSQILFRAIMYRDLVEELTGMFQKEVAERVCAEKGNKTYGILSVLCQAYYDCGYLFTVHEDVFDPPPRVKSGVLRMRRKQSFPDVDYKVFSTLVKTAFSQRRKKLRNVLSGYKKDLDLSEEMFQLRAEQLSVEEFISLAKQVK